jgi:hypothetical protein
MSNVKTCPTCSAQYVNDVHYWSTGKLGNDLDLAGLVCNPFGKGRACINPKRGLKGGQTWEERSANLDAALTEFDLFQEKSYGGAKEDHPVDV